ncbi:MAG: hypothetical protein ABIZ36_03550 [Gemmatimonadaceae bacterium]
MDRRRFIGTGAASAASVLAGSACVPLARLSDPRPRAVPGDMNAYLARIDASMERMGRWSSATWAPEFKGNRQAADAIGRSAFQAMYLTGMASDLPLEGQLHPGMQERIEANMPLMDEATDRMSDFLRAQTPADLATVQLALREHSAGARIFTALDDEAGVLGVSDWRRDQTRTIYSNAEWRLRNQPPSLLLTEYIEKVERLGASEVSNETRTQALTARLAEEAFWASEAPPNKRHARINRGGKVMGYGVLTFAAGAGIVAAGSVAGLFVATVGVVMLLVGLVILLVGLSTPNGPAMTGSMLLSPG